MSELIRVNGIVREGGHDRAVRRAADRGELIQVARGRYVPASEWDVLERDAQYRLRVRAFAETTRMAPVFSHWSAAALWGYPIIGSWPGSIHVSLDPHSGVRSTRGVVRHSAHLGDDVVEHDGLLLTTPLRTLVDLARSAPFSTGVAACDFALSGSTTSTDAFLRVPREAILERARRLTGQRGVRRLRSVADFADGRSGSPGESFSRVQFLRMGLPAPDLQVEVLDFDGRLWHSDFGWQSYGLLGEFDGMVKYTRDRYLRGRDLAQVVIEEKLREDAIRVATGFRMARWIWPVAADRAQLGQLLHGAGLHGAKLHGAGLHRAGPAQPLTPP